jgi:hypothetical protein
MKTILLLLGVFALSATLVAQTNVPVGTVIPVRLNSAIDVRRSQPGQMLTAKVAQDVPLYNGAKIKAGSRVLGEVLAVTPAENSQPATIALRFNRIEMAGQTTPLLTDLRALASPGDVASAQEDTLGSENGLLVWDETTVQIGGDVVYREGGPVARGLETVGTPVNGGVLARVASSPGDPCRGATGGNDNPQALWVFSHDACGVYGYEAVITHAGRTNPEGRIVLASTNGNLKLRSGSAMLLRVNGTSSHLPQSDVASK